MTHSHVHAASRGKPMIRPAWTPATIALMVLGFIAYWPLGLAMIAYIVWGDRLPEFKREANRMADNLFGGKGAARTQRDTGNVAFDDWRSAELKRLDEERARLEAMREEFEDYARELRRAKDQEDFDRFMASRRREGRGQSPTIDAE